jgi:hypothetical protein
MATPRVTLPVLDRPVDTVALFRRHLDLDEVPAEAPCRVWVDGRYLLTVNGTEVARGPVRSDPRRSHYDVVDLAPALRPGPNVLAVVARRYAEATSWWVPVPPTYSLGGGSLVLEARVGRTWVVSDRSWRCTPGAAWTPVVAPGEVASLPLEWFDARHHPWGWDRAGFDDGGWAPAVELVPAHTGADGSPRVPSEPFGMLLPPVRRSFPGGAHHAAVEVARRTVARTTGAAVGSGTGRSPDGAGGAADGPGGGPADGPGGGTVPDPVAQVLADGDRPTVESGFRPERAVELVTFDLGRVAAGSVILTASDLPAGAVVDVMATEHLDAGGEPAPLGQHAGFRYVAAGRPEERFTTFDVVGARFLRASVRGAAGPASLSLAVADRHRPRPPGARFACSDPVLERIYEVGLRTVDLCALDAYVDCPTREQRAWTGDSVVHQMVDLVANPDWSMAVWHPQLAAVPRPDGLPAMTAASDFWADDRTVIPDWALHWVRSVANLHRYVGDRTLTAELLPVVTRALRWFETFLGADGLLHDVTGWSLVDWASVYTQGTSSAVNALWARALEDLAAMAAGLGEGATAAWAAQRYEGVRAAFDLFWDEGRGVYVDHVVDGVPGRPAAQHGGAAALAAGLVPPGRADRVVDRLVDRSRLVRRSWAMDTVTVGGDSSGMLTLVTGPPAPDWDAEEQMVEAEPFFRYVLHDGVARAGRADLVAGLVRDWAVFLDAGETTWPECWTGGTRCHGWSSTPTRDLIVHVLGIHPAEPGYGAVSVRPALGDLAWARATVPTPHGPVTVEAHQDGSVEVDSPVPVVAG